MSWDGAAQTASLDRQAYPALSVDIENRASFAAGETALQSGFDWYTWTFQIDPAIDTVEYAALNDHGYDWWTNEGKLVLEDPEYCASVSFTVGSWIEMLDKYSAG